MKGAGRPIPPQWRVVDAGVQEVRNLTCLSVRLVKASGDDSKSSIIGLGADIEPQALGMLSSAP